MATAMTLLAACDSAEERKVSHYENGLKLVEAGQPGKAVLEFTNALRIDDKYMPAHAALGRLQMQRGKLAPAAGHLQIVADADPQDLETRVELARIYLELRALDRALAAADEALKLAPEDPKALSLRAALDLLLGNPDSAARRARAALAADPGVELALMVLVAERLRAGAPRDALAILDAAPTGGGTGDSPDLDLVRVQVLEQLGDRDAVGATLERLLARKPDDAELRLALARWHMQAVPPDLDGAEAQLREIAARAPDETASQLRLVDFLRQARGPEAARAELERLVAAARAAAGDPARAGTKAKAGSGDDDEATAGLGAAETAALYERQLALLEAQSGDRAAAAARLEAIIARDGESKSADAARLLLARLVEGTDAAAFARRAGLVGDVLRHDPANAEALGMRAELSLREDRIDDAIADLRTALDQSPRDPALLELLAVAYERNGDDTLAAERRAVAVQASNSAPGPTLRYAAQLSRTNKLGTAESILLDALARAPTNRPLLSALADVRLRRQDWAGARQVAMALKALDDDALSGAVGRLQAAALLGEGRTDETLSLLQDGWDARGGASDMEALVRAFTAAGELGKAEAFLAKVLEDDPSNARAMALMANVKTMSGDRQAAEALLRQAVAAAPDDARLHQLLNRFLLSEGRPDAAAEALEAGLSASPDDPQLRFDKAMLLEQEGAVEDAIAIYEKLHDENPGDPLVANNLASLLSDHRADAESLQRAAVVARRLRGAASPAFQDTYGWTLHLSGESDRAVAVLRVSAPALAGNPIAQYHLGMAYAAIGQEKLAIEQLTLALDLAGKGAQFPQRAEAEAELARLKAMEKASETERKDG